MVSSESPICAAAPNPTDGIAESSKHQHGTIAAHTLLELLFAQAGEEVLQCFVIVMPPRRSARVAARHVVPEEISLDDAGHGEFSSFCSL